MKFTTSILFISMMFYSILSQANDLLSDEDFSLQEELDQLDQYDRQDILRSLEALLEDLQNAESTEDGYRIHFKTPGAAMAVTSIAGAVAATDAVAGTGTGAAAGASAAGAVDPDLPRAARDASPPARAATSPRPPLIDPQIRPSAAAPPPPLDSDHWKSKLTAVNSGTMKEKLVHIADGQPGTSSLNIRRLNRRGTKFLVGHPTDKRKNLLLRFSRNGNRVTMFRCTNSKQLLTWFRIFGTLGSSCARYGALRVDTRTREGTKVLVDAISDVHPEYTGLRRMPKGIFFGGGFFWRWAKRIIAGSAVAVIGTGMYVSYADDGQIEFAEVSEETLEILVLLFGGMLESLSNNDKVNGVLDNMNW